VRTTLRFLHYSGGIAIETLTTGENARQIGESMTAIDPAGERSHVIEGDRGIGTL
jgi:hypothetical protein